MNEIGKNMKTSPFYNVILVNVMIFLTLFLSVGYGFAQDAGFVQKLLQQVGFFGIILQSGINLVLGVRNRFNETGKAHIIVAALPLLPAMFFSYMFLGNQG